MTKNAILSQGYELLIGCVPAVWRQQLIQNFAQIRQTRLKLSLVLDTASVNNQLQKMKRLKFCLLSGSLTFGKIRSLYGGQRSE